MFVIQIILITIGVTVYTYVLLHLSNQFGKQYIKYVSYLLVPIYSFSIGFILRLSGNKDFVDLGYFFTESALVLSYLILTFSMLLGPEV